MLVPDAATIEPPRLADTSGGTMRTRIIALVLPLGLLWFILCRHLSNEWSVNEQYSYGWFVPFFAAYLFWLRWEERVAPEVEGRNAKGENPRSALRTPPSPLRFPLSTLALLLLLLLLPLRAFEVGNPDWRPLGGLHAGIVVGLTLLLLWRIGGWPWLRHFAFPVGFIFVAVPWVTPVEAPIVQGLMRVVASIAAEVLALFGIPAQLEGSVIRISSGVVGVNEACSGVRSLQTSLMIGLLFGELKRLSVRRRFVLLFSALAIAFAANCARAFFLVWIAATQGVAAVSRWHDTAGYAILGAVFLGTVALASALTKKVGNLNSKGENAPTNNRELITNNFRTPSPLPHSALRVPKSAIFASLAWLVFVEGSVETWYRSHERDLVATAKWDVRWPEDLSGFREISINEDVKATLRFDRGRQVAWSTKAASAGETQVVPESWSMFFFRWEPRTTSILRARAHRPDICLPNTGWRVTEDHGVSAYRVADAVEMPFRHFTFSHEAGEHRSTASAHAFFCQREDRVPSLDAARFDLIGGAATSNWMRADRLRVVREGLRNQGQQVLEVVLMTPQEVSGKAAQAKFAELVPQIVSFHGQ